MYLGLPARHMLSGQQVMYPCLESCENVVSKITVAMAILRRVPCTMHGKNKELRESRLALALTACGHR